MITKISNTVDLASVIRSIKSLWTFKKCWKTFSVCGFVSINFFSWHFFTILDVVSGYHTAKWVYLYWTPNTHNRATAADWQR